MTFLFYFQPFLLDDQMTLFPPYQPVGSGVFSFWYEGEEKEGFIRYLTPIESERLMGLPEDWTKYGNTGIVTFEKDGSDNY